MHREARDERDAEAGFHGVVTHEVENYEIWKRAFDQHAASRKSAGIVATHINRDAAQPNLLSAYLAGNDAAKLAGFLHSQDLMTTMRDADYGA